MTHLCLVGCANQLLKWTDGVAQVGPTLQSGDSHFVPEAIRPSPDLRMP